MHMAVSDIAMLNPFEMTNANSAADEVASIARSLQGTCLGWFVHQQAPRRQASVRERAVTAAMAGCVPHGMPVIFALMCTNTEADTSTHNFQQQFFEQVWSIPCLTCITFDWILLSPSALGMERFKPQSCMLLMSAVTFQALQRCIHNEQDEVTLMYCLKF